MAILWSSVVPIKKEQAKPLAIKYIRHFPFQVLISELLELWGDEGFFKHTKSVQDFYLQQRNAMVAAAEKHLSGWYCIHIFLNYFSVNRYYISDYLVSRLLFLRKKTVCSFLSADLCEWALPTGGMFLWLKVSV